MGILDDAKRWAGLRSQRQREAKEEYRDFLEAVVAASALVAYTNEVVESEEMAKLVQFAGMNETLSLFELEEVMAAFERHVSQFEFDPRLGKLKAFKAITKIPKGSEEAKLLVLVSCAVAEANGEMESKEKAIINEICWKLGLDRREFIFPDPEETRPAPTLAPFPGPRVVKPKKAEVPDWMQQAKNMIEAHREKSLERRKKGESPDIPEWMRNPHLKPPGANKSKKSAGGQKKEKKENLPDWMQQARMRIEEQRKKALERKKKAEDPSIPEWMR